MVPLLGSLPLYLKNSPSSLSSAVCRPCTPHPSLLAPPGVSFLHPTFCSLNCACLFISPHVYDLYFSLKRAPQSRPETVLTPHRGVPGLAPSGARKIRERIARLPLSWDVGPFCGMCTLSLEMLLTKLATEGCRLWGGGGGGEGGRREKVRGRVRQQSKEASWPTRSAPGSPGLSGGAAPSL